MIGSPRDLCIRKILLSTGNSVPEQGRTFQVSTRRRYAVSLKLREPFSSIGRSRFISSVIDRSSMQNVVMRTSNRKPGRFYRHTREPHTRPRIKITRTLYAAHGFTAARLTFHGRRDNFHTRKFPPRFSLARARAARYEIIRHALSASRIDGSSKCTKRYTAGLRCNVTLRRLMPRSIFLPSFFFLDPLSIAVGKERAFASFSLDGSERWPRQITAICNPLK